VEQGGTLVHGSLFPTPCHDVSFFSFSFGLAVIFLADTTHIRLELNSKYCQNKTFEHVPRDASASSSEDDTLYECIFCIDDVRTRRGELALAV
jgi:hypothetical protein